MLIFARNKPTTKMLTPYKITDYIIEYNPHWTCKMPEGCPPNDVMVATNHPFFRLARQVDEICFQYETAYTYRYFGIL